MLCRRPKSFAALPTTGGPEQDRTVDLLTASQALSQTELRARERHYIASPFRVVYGFCASTERFCEGGGGSVLSSRPVFARRT